LRKRFKATTSELSLLPLDEPQLRELNRTIDKEQALYETLLKRRLPKPPERQSLIEGYMDLTDLARGVLDVSNALTDREIESLRTTAARAQDILWLHLLATVPLGVLISVAVTVFIARPVRQLDQAIRRLGSGEFSSGIRISGPGDLEYLGARLEWLRQRLVELEQQKQLFLRHVSHELKTPLTALREGSELLADGTAGPLAPAQREIVGILRDKSAQLQNLIEDLLNYQHAQQSVGRLDLGTTRVDELVRRVLDDHRLAISSRAIRTEVRMEPLAIRADAEKLRVIVDNLLSNAVKYSPDGGTISLALRRDGANMCFEVGDSGPGISRENRERIFDWFFRGERGEGKVRGTGLGLAIAREFVLAHNGNITVGDNGARGARFRVSLPAAPFGTPP
jgi:two-component system sensor histidine kinase GlrK